jgi:hypothetical protein
VELFRKDRTSKEDIMRQFFIAFGIAAMALSFGSSAHAAKKASVARTAAPSTQVGSSTKCYRNGIKMGYSSGAIASYCGGR